MQDVADQSVAPTTIGADLCAIFVSLELSRSTWLVTSLSPGRGEKMSKHSVSAGDIAALLARFSELRRKACARTGRSFPVIVRCCQTKSPQRLVVVASVHEQPVPLFQ